MIGIFVVFLTIITIATLASGITITVIAEDDRWLVGAALILLSATCFYVACQTVFLALQWI